MYLSQYTRMILLINSYFCKYKCITLIVLNCGYWEYLKRTILSSILVIIKSIEFNFLENMWELICFNLKYNKSITKIKY